MAKRLNSKTMGSARSIKTVNDVEPSRAERREYHWWVPVGFAVAMAETKTGTLVESGPLEEKAIEALENLLLDFLEKKGFKVVDELSTTKPYIGNAFGVETRFRGAAKPEPQPEPTAPAKRGRKPAPPPVNENLATEEDLAAMPISELRAWCEELEVDESGSKKMLIGRLLEAEVELE